MYMKPSGLPSKKQKVYNLCKNFIALTITVVVLVPIIYILGSDDSLYPSRPLFSAYAEDPYFQAKIAEIQSALKNNLVVNLHLQGKDNSTRQWEHLKEFVRYLGYRFNRQEVATINRLITPAEVKQQKKGKNTPSAQNLRLQEKTYAFVNNGQMNVLRNKLNKVALNTINRLKIKQKEVKNAGISGSFKKAIIDEVVAPKVWIITIHPGNWKYHSSQELKKQITALSKEKEKDSFIVVSFGPADPEWKKMKPIPIIIDQSVFSSIKGKLKQIIKASFPFQINTTRVIESVLCQYQTSLYQLNNFLQNCNSTFSCYNSIKLLSKKTKKGEDSQAVELLNELCTIGHFDEEDAEFSKVLNDLGFYGDHSAAEDSIKLYFAIGNGKRCKGAKQCNYQWLMKEPKTQQNQTKQQPKKLETNKTQTPAKDIVKKEIPVQAVTQSLKKEKTANKTKNKTKTAKNKTEEKASQKPKKQSKKEEQNPTSKNQNQIKSSQSTSKKKSKQKIVNSPKTIEKSQKQSLKSSSKLKNHQKADQQRQVKVEQVQKVVDIPEEKIEIVVDDYQQNVSNNQTSHQSQAKENNNIQQLAQPEEENQSKEDAESKIVDIPEQLIQSQAVTPLQGHVAVQDESNQQLADEKQHLEVVEQEQKQQLNPVQIQNNQQINDGQTKPVQIQNNLQTKNDQTKNVQTQNQQTKNEYTQNEQLNPLQIQNNEQIDNEQIDNEQIDNEQIDNQQIDNQQIDNQQIDNQQIDNQQTNKEQAIIEQNIATDATEIIQPNNLSEPVQTPIKQDEKVQIIQQPTQQVEQNPIEPTQAVESIPNQSEKQQEPSQVQPPEPLQQQQDIAIVQPYAIVEEKL